MFLPPEGDINHNQIEIVESIGDRHDLRIYDHGLSAKEQFNDIEVVIDQGGSIGTREMMDEAKDTMVWQAMGTGLDHGDLEYMKSCGFTITHTTDASAEITNILAEVEGTLGAYLALQQKSGGRADERNLRQ